jgi:hypothetical protein
MHFCYNLITSFTWLLPFAYHLFTALAIRGPREIRMVEGHMRTEHGKRVACWSGFPLEGVHRFESPRLSDMSNRLFVAVFM